MYDIASVDLLRGKTEYTIGLFRFCIDEFSKIGVIEITPLKSMIAIEGQSRRAYITQFGKNFLHIVFPFNQAYEDNLCFTKIAQVPNTNQFNHHLRIYSKDDINDEVKEFMRMALGNSELTI